MTREGAPLGEREDVRTEFKRAAVLAKLDSVAAAVVAMLNAGGGVVWIGVEERDERAVGLEDIACADKERRRIEDVLTDTVEPSPTSDEARVEVVRDAHGARLRITVGVSQRGPFAQLRDNAWRHYRLRVGGRTRLMTREELRTAFAGTTRTDDEVERGFDQAWGEEMKDKPSILWVRTAISPSIALSLDANFRQLILRLLMQPEATGNRAMGWNFCTEGMPVELRPTGSGLEAGGPTSHTWVTVERDGTQVFRAPIAFLEHKAAGDLYPYALAELPVSAIRVAATLYTELGADPSAVIAADVALRGVASKTLRPGSPRSLAFQLKARSPESDNVRAGVQTERLDALARNPDRLGWRLVRRLYESFGFWPDDMPSELYDEANGRLSFPPEPR